MMATRVARRDATLYLEYAAGRTCRPRRVASGHPFSKPIFQRYTQGFSINHKHIPYAYGWGWGVGGSGVFLRTSFAGMMATRVARRDATLYLEYAAGRSGRLDANPLGIHSPNSSFKGTPKDSQ